MNFLEHINRVVRSRFLPSHSPGDSQGLSRPPQPSGSSPYPSSFSHGLPRTLFFLVAFLLPGCEKPPTANIPPVVLSSGTPFRLEQPPLPPPSTKGAPYVGVLSGILSRPNLLVATGYQGTLLRKEGDRPWIRIPVPGDRDLYGVVASPGGDFWAYGDRGTLLRSSDRGVHWTPVALSPSPRFLSGVFFVDGRTGYAAGSQGAFYRTTDGGNRWSPVALPTRANLYAVVFSDGSHGLVAGWHRTLLRTSDGGATWQPIAVPMQRVTRQKPSFNALFEEGGRFFLAGDHGLLYLSTDEGASFSAIQTGSLHDLYGVCRTGDGTLAVAGEEGTLLFLSPERGGGWAVRSPLGSFHGSDFLGLSCGASRVRLAGSRNVLLLPAS